MYKYTVKKSLVDLHHKRNPRDKEYWFRYPGWEWVTNNIAPLLGEEYKLKTHLLHMAFKDFHLFCFYSKNGNLNHVYINGYAMPVSLFDVEEV